MEVKILEMERVQHEQLAKELETLRLGIAVPRVAPPMLQQEQLPSSFIPMFVGHMPQATSAVAASCEEKKYDNQPSAIVVSPSILQTFLNHVVAGRQDEAENLLKQNSTIALAASTITDHVGRTFRNITGFQYAVWNLDWHMWKMIEKYLPIEAAHAQSEGFKNGSWIREYGEHVSWQKLIDNYKTYIDDYDLWTREECRSYWVGKIGRVQLTLPMHVIQEYCEPSRPFFPVPDFNTDIVLTRKLPHWVLKGNVGKTCTICRSRLACPFPAREAHLDSHSDMPALVQLYKTRIQQREQLVDKLINDNINPGHLRIKIHNL